jgi:hypothetical protein
MNFQIVSCLVFLFAFCTAFCKPYMPSFAPGDELLPLKETTFFKEFGRLLDNFEQYTFGLAVKVETDQEKIDWIMENRNHEITQILDQHIYLAPERITQSEFGTFLSIENGFFLKLPQTFSDEKGCYILKK